jgi:Divergent InlB B-repeat domain/Matrixin
MGRLVPAGLVVAAVVSTALAPPPAEGFALRIASPGNRLTMNLNLETMPLQTLGYGVESVKSLAEFALSRWNEVGIGPQRDHAFFSVSSPTVPPAQADPCTSDGVNEVRFASTNCGLGWGNVIGVTRFYCIGSCVGGAVFETDVLFNETVAMDAYPGPLLPQPIDFVRLAIHEFGHAAGLDHPDEAGQTRDAVMNSVIDDEDDLQPDDIAGANAIMWNEPGQTVLLTVGRVGSGTVTSAPAGIDCPLTCVGGYASGTMVTLTATADPGSTFTGWSGAGCQGTGTCVVNLAADRMVTATFAAPPGSFTLTVTVDGTGSGIVTSNPAGIHCPGTCAAPFTSGITVTLTAGVAAGSIFAGWSGGNCSGTGTCQVTLTADTTVTATFNSTTPPSSFTLTMMPAGTGTGTVTSNPAGIRCPPTCAGSYASGATVVLTAAAGPGSRFAGWSGASCAGVGACQVTLTANTTVTATFDAGSTQTFTLTVTPTGAGSGMVTSAPAGVNCSPTCAASFASGTLVTLTGAPSSSSVFAGWQGACSGDGLCVVSMTADRAVTAVFLPGGTLVPVLNAPADQSGFSLSPASVATFGWSAVAGAARYVFEFTGPNLAFTNPNGTVFDAVNGAGGAGGGCPILLDASIPPGTYQVRVIGMSASSQLIGAFSNALTLFLGVSPGPKVTITTPVNGTQLQRGATVTFAWTALAGAAQYGFEFTGTNRQFANQNGTSPDGVNGFGGAGGGLLVPGTSLTVPIDPSISPGTYQVRVIGLSATGQLLGQFSDAVTIVIQ